MQKIKFLLQSVLTIAIIIAITTALYLYTAGYRLQQNKQEMIDFTKTGMVSAKSFPEGASVYLDEKLVTATNDTIAGIEPGIHNIKILKKGFLNWEKDIEIFEELVTDITAVLISQSPRIEPLTTTGARDPIISPTLNKIAYFSYDEETPGIWVISLGGPGGLNIFRSTPSIAIEDTRFTKYSQGQNLRWSPDENSLLVTGSNNVTYLIDLTNNTSQTTSSPDLVEKEWAETLKEKRSTFIEKLEITEDIRLLALAPDSYWAPDEKKFMYRLTNNDTIEYRVHNLEKPLPIGEDVDTLVFSTKTTDPQPQISWYSDSFHLILLEGNVEQDKRGTVSLIRIDGTNKTEIYNNTLYSNKAYGAPGGDKIIILTSFKSTGQTDLYTVSIR